MNKRMKDPKGDLRFVHKSTRVYDFWSLKLTAMAVGRRAGKKRDSLWDVFRLIHKFPLQPSTLT